MLDKWYGKRVRVHEKIYSSLTSVDIPFNKGINVFVGVLTKSFNIGNNTWILIDDKTLINLNEIFAIELDD